MSDDRLDLLDYYDLLQIEPEADADAIRDGFHAFARRYHPDRFAGAPPEKQARAAQIYRRGAEAYRVLLEPAERRLYDQGLQRGERRLDVTRSTRPPGPAAESGRLETRNLKARPFLQKAISALKSGDLATARLNLKITLGHEPDNAAVAAKLQEIS